jgi:hypothetical protein
MIKLLQQLAMGTDELSKIYIHFKYTATMGQILSHATWSGQHGLALPYRGYKSSTSRQSIMNVVN